MMSIIGPTTVGSAGAYGCGLRAGGIPLALSTSETRAAPAPFASDVWRSFMATKTKARTFPTSIYLNDDVRQQVIEILNQHLADTADLYSQVKQAHWNVKGQEFFQLHKMF